MPTSRVGTLKNNSSVPTRGITNTPLYALHKLKKIVLTAASLGLKHGFTGFMFYEPFWGD